MRRIFHYLRVGQSNGFGAATEPYADRLPRGCTLQGQNGFCFSTVDRNGRVRSSDRSTNVFSQGGRPQNVYQSDAEFLQTVRGLIGGPADIHNIINCCSNGTSSVQWASGLTTTPISINNNAQTLIQVARLRLTEALRIRNSVLVGMLIYQGESNAQGIAGRGPAEYITDWTNICDYFAAQFPFAAQLKFVQVKLPLPVPVSIPFPDWLGVRDAQDTLQASRSDMLTIDSDSSTTVRNEDYHLQTPSLRVVGRRAAEAFGSFGIAA